MMIFPDIFGCLTFFNLLQLRQIYDLSGIYESNVQTYFTMHYFNNRVKHDTVK